MKMSPFRPKAVRAFTVIELLVVIAIILILAGMVVHLLPGITEKKVRARVGIQLSALELAINAYKAKIFSHLKVYSFVLNVSNLIMLFLKPGNVNTLNQPLLP